MSFTSINRPQSHNKTLLINSCNNVQSHSEESKESIEGTNIVSSHRKKYWELVRFQNKYAPRKTMRLCNRSPISHKDGVKSPLVVKDVGKRAFYGNLMTCKGFFCPNCAEVFRAEQRVKARKGIDSAINNKFSVQMLTLTVPRSYANDNFEEKFKIINTAFRFVMNGLRTRIKGKKFIRENGVVELWTMKGIDVTMDSNREDPCHLHIHSLIITSKPIVDIEDWIWRTYKRHLEKKGVKVSRKGFDIRQVLEDKEITDYIVKTLGTIERELTSTKKEGRDGKSKGWFSWLCSIVENPSKRDIYLYREFLKASKNKRTQDFSRNWDRLVDLGLKIEDIGMEIEDKDDKIEINNSFYWVLDLELWGAIKNLKIEEEVLLIVDNFIDRGKCKELFYELKSIVELNVDKVFGKEKKKFYCNLLRSVVGLFYTK